MAIRTSGTRPSPMQALLEGGAVAGLTDVELLDRFVAGRGEAAEAAFAALVDRHGPMVLGLCRRIIADRHAAEDAFQATFLILARRAALVRVGDTLGRWLYGVGRRVALRERANASRRPRSAGLAVEAWEAAEVVDPLRELASVLDEEIARLPRRSREVVALCHVEGLSFVEAATRIGCRVGTIGSRLTRARTLLGTRLARRGFGPALILAAVDARASAEVPSILARETARFAAAGQHATIPAAVATLCTDTTRAMIMVKLKIAAAVTLAAGLLAAGAKAIQAPAGPPPSTKPPATKTESSSTALQDYEALIREYKTLMDEESEARRKGEPEFGEFRRKHPGFRSSEFAGRFLELARSHTGDPSTFDALLWAVVFGFTSDASDQAASILARDHSRDPRLWPACQEMRRGPVCPAWGILLRAIHRDNPDRALRGRAGLALVNYLMDQAEFVRLARTTGPGPYQGRFFPAARMDQFRKLDPDAMALEAEEACERVISDYADIRPVTLVRSPYMEFDARMVYRSVQDAEAPRGTIGELAGARLDEVRSLAIGKPAPAIEGINDQGKPMILGGFRGKVVLLTFSGDWCGPCVSMYPHERELVKRFEGRPFALLSVNSDKTKEELTKTIEAGTITWRCWWEPLGDEVGPIAERWHIRGWPTIFLIDQRGIIRARSGGTLGPGDKFITGLDEAIESLIGEAEHDSR